ncbi:uncharacterized protein I206_100358 [Kwoniella pini CBS 10737]|uniref:Uncharacterized protein n=1 Tax=Kwoniella pini CBS 10737 TaxID=1296096 RepID=A0A1B9IE03_9TREE|nr:uncharacterized protein I206_00967 [Kwoniella pini CBS 10737]OCF53661.1 hypothetical protein I206_00967 [Kwoniella pini CBS 10737]
MPSNDSHQHTGLNSADESVSSSIAKLSLTEHRDDFSKFEDVVNNAKKHLDGKLAHVSIVLPGPKERKVDETSYHNAMSGEVLKRWEGLQKSEQSRNPSIPARLSTSPTRDSQGRTMLKGEMKRDISVMLDSTQKEPTLIFRLRVIIDNEMQIAVSSDVSTAVDLSATDTPYYGQVRHLAICSEVLLQDASDV